MAGPRNNTARGGRDHRHGIDRDDARGRIPMTVVDRNSFPTVGAGLWWAAQTVTTVGYGDHVPESVAGQLVAVLVMLFGIGFLQ